MELDDTSLDPHATVVTINLVDYLCGGVIRMDTMLRTAPR